jgi:hypothetical protein
MRQTRFIYAIVDVNMINVLGLNPHTLRYNNTHSMFLFKTYKEEPRLVNTRFYSKERIKDILHTNEWRNSLNIN